MYVLLSGDSHSRCVYMQVHMHMGMCFGCVSPYGITLLHVFVALIESIMDSVGISLEHEHVQMVVENSPSKS